MEQEQIKRLTDALRHLRDISVNADDHTFGEYRRALMKADDILKEVDNGTGTGDQG